MSVLTLKNSCFYTCKESRYVNFNFQCAYFDFEDV